MSSQRHAKLAAALLAKAGLESEAGPPLDGAARTRAIAAVEVALAARARRQKRRVLLQRVAGIAAVVALGFGGYAAWSLGRVMPHDDRAAHDAHDARVAVTARAATEGVLLIGPRGRAPLQDGESLVRGERVVTGAASGVALALSTGTRISLEQASDLAVLETDALQRFMLSAGALHTHVAKLGAAQRFVIDTPDSEIEVRGTTFRVEVRDAIHACRGARTRVLVTEGVVQVRHEGVSSRVAAGESWPAACDAHALAGRGAASIVPSQGPALPPADQMHALPPADQMHALPPADQMHALPPADQMHALPPADQMHALPPHGGAHAPARESVSAQHPPTATHAAHEQAVGAGLSDQEVLPRADDTRGREAPSGRDDGAALAASTLAAENDDFATALDLARTGHGEEARLAFTRFLEAHPRSPLAESARIELGRLARARQTP